MLTFIPTTGSASVRLVWVVWWTLLTLSCHPKPEGESDSGSAQVMDLLSESEEPLIARIPQPSREGVVHRPPERSARAAWSFWKSFSWPAVERSESPELALSPAVTASELASAIAGFEDPKLVRALHQAYENEGRHLLLLRPEIPLDIPVAIANLLAQALSMGMTPEDTCWTFLTDSLPDSCRWSFGETAPLVPELEQRLSGKGCDGAAAHLGLHCVESPDWSSEQLTRLDVALVAGFLSTLWILEGKPEEFPLWPGAGSAVTRWVSSVPDNPRFACRVRALRLELARRAAGLELSTPAGSTLKKGKKGARVLALKERLSADGFLRRGDMGDLEVFDSKLRSAVRAARKASGLKSSSAADEEFLDLYGPGSTLRSQILWHSLNETLVRHSEMEDTYVLVQIPQFTTSLVVQGKTRQTYRSVVGFSYGEVPGGRTPAMSSHLSYVDINPEWVPSNDILEKEIRPKSRRDPSYFAENRFVVRDGKTVQLPGPQNTLGQLLIAFPNDKEIALHGTSEPHRYEYWDRALSHGCVRVEGIEDLVSRLFALLSVELAPPLTELLRGLEERRVELNGSIPIHIVYDRVGVLADGRVVLLPDPYHLEPFGSVDDRKDPLDLLLSLAGEK